MNGSWDPAWEKVFSTREWGRYPPEDLIRFIARNFYRNPNRKSVKILDAGCGTGSCSWFIAREGFTVIGVDGSPTALYKCKKRFMQENLSGDFIRGDLIGLPFPDATFDAVFDICSFSQNKFGQIRKIIGESRRVLKNDGVFFSMFFREGCWGDGLGKKIEPGTFTEIPEGPFHELGVTHFATEAEVNELFGQFSSFSYETITRTFDERKREVSYWLIMAKR